DGSLLFTDIGVAQDSKTLGVCRHHAVLDTVVDHFYEMTRSVGTAVEIAELSGAIDLFASWRPRNVARTRCEPLEDWIEMPHCRRFAANHHAVAPLQPPYATARADIHIVNPLRCEFLRAPDIINVIGITAVDKNVTGFEVSPDIRDGVVHDRSRYHQPDH